ncbi:uncharacterized protein K452DRAFT_40325 [Aplosporella prunicola CBS 121167]|uniref:F-box domain-containing protein n=1 Tax=Aplosporella prunicola CBS 121167 TaxID=1176127 RepID=A0A6A6BDY1_9PEZI|nr:uncharacterized protein K452DRAFT_40325 [Aplosporella prunicola CBS 121167]KAF2141505.1 hypothetical protein K452DRAFT_40325 [Aplosporella prunicola CBS 121167]
MSAHAASEWHSHTASAIVATAVVACAIAMVVRAAVAPSSSSSARKSTLERSSSDNDEAEAGMARRREKERLRQRHRRRGGGPARDGSDADADADASTTTHNYNYTRPHLNALPAHILLAIFSHLVPTGDGVLLRDHHGHGDDSAGANATRTHLRFCTRLRLVSRRFAALAAPLACSVFSARSNDNVNNAADDDDARRYREARARERFVSELVRWPERATWVTEVDAGPVGGVRQCAGAVLAAEELADEIVGGEEEEDGRKRRAWLRALRKGGDDADLALLVALAPN